MELIQIDPVRAETLERGVTGVLDEARGLPVPVSSRRVASCEYPNFVAMTTLSR